MLEIWSQFNMTSKATYDRDISRHIRIYPDVPIQRDMSVSFTSLIVMLDFKKKQSCYNAVRFCYMLKGRGDQLSGVSRIASSHGIIIQPGRPSRVAAHHHLGH